MPRETYQKSGGSESLTTRVSNPYFFGGHSFQQGSSQQTFDRVVRIREALDALIRLSGGQSFGYDQNAWHRWPASETMAGEEGRMKAVRLWEIGMSDIEFQSLPQDVRDFLGSKVASGEYSSINEITVTALRAYRDKERYTAWLKAEIQAGIDELDAGLEEPWDIEEIRAELRAELDEQGRPRQ